MSFSSNLLKKYQTSIALHQLPSRKKEGKMVKKALIAPEGYGFVCFDVSAQELKFMAQMSKDPVMIQCFNEGLDLHSKLASEMFGVPYLDLVEANKNGEPHHLVKYRSAGKRVNLSSQYRAGSATLAEKFFTMDDEVIEESTCKSYLQTYKRTYEGIPRYWRSAIEFARDHKYTEALGGLRYYTDARNWQGESSAINHPIQGSAAMMSYYMIARIFERFPEFIMQLQVHDSLMYIVKVESEEELKDWALKLEAYLNTEINYEEIFKSKLVVRLLCDVSFGYSYGDLKHV
jgi:DNA polymerase-1